MDGSIHDWFEGQREDCCLMNMVDDATATRRCRFEEEETTAGAMRLLWAWIERYGIPKALYTDKKNVYVPDERVRREAREEGREVFTQFGRACHQLGIRIIAANSPQAKGRVERSHRVYQDRLVKEMRLLGTGTIEDANHLLESGFTDHLNGRFAVEAAEAVDYHRPAEDVDLAAVFCIEEERSVTPDWMVRFENRFFQLVPLRKGESARGKVKVQRRLDSSLHFQFGERYLEYSELPERPQPLKSPKKKKRSPASTVMDKYVSPSDHPWRLMQIGKGSPLHRP